MPRNTSVTLGEHFDAFVGRKIAEGRYQSVSEAVRAGLRRLEEDEAKLEALEQNCLQVRTALWSKISTRSDFSPKCVRSREKRSDGGLPLTCPCKSGP